MKKLTHVDIEKCQVDRDCTYDEAIQYLKAKVHKAPTNKSINRNKPEGDL